MKTNNKLKKQQHNEAHKLTRDIGVFYLVLLVVMMIVPVRMVQADTNLYVNQTTDSKVTEHFPTLIAVGRGELTWFGLSIYHASLWTATGEYQSVKDSLPIALTITYNKNIKSDALAKRTVKEWKSLGLFDDQWRKYWGQRLRQIWPNVAPGDSITTLVTANRKTRFYHNDKLLSDLADPTFGTALLSIWLDDETSEPDLREKLIGQAGD
jgi:hypothetical protein